MLKSKVFICGCGHSGTTLLLMILAAHSKCYGIPYETNIFLNGNGNIEPFVQEALQVKKEVLIEKTPKHVFRIAHILRHISNSKIIVCVRNPLDVIGSLQQRFCWDINKSIVRYIEDNMAYMPFKHNSNVFLVRYEDLVSDTENALLSICHFIGIDFEKNMLDYHSRNVNFGNITDAELTDGKEGINHRLLRNYQIHQPISDKRGEWRNIIPSSGRPRISPEEYDFVKRKTLKLANTLGYTYQESYMLPES